jgi:rare lipoprotein A (peptidoglycan hydrolase)
MIKTKKLKSKTKKTLTHAHKILKSVHRSTKKSAKQAHHFATKKKLTSKKRSQQLSRAFFIIIAAICTGSLSLMAAAQHPNVSVQGGSRLTTGTKFVAEKPKDPNAPDQVGQGSWYALGLPAPDTLTCASTTYGRGSYLEVTNRRNGKKVICRVNDYGPEAWTGRVIDLSRGSFREVEDLGRGTIPVEIRVVSAPQGLIIPLNLNVGELFGYNLCRSIHPFNFCDANRQADSIQ